MVRKAFAVLHDVMPCTLDGSISTLNIGTSYPQRSHVVYLSDFLRIVSEMNLATTLSAWMDG